MKKKVVLASYNAGKIKEFSALLASFDIELIPQASLGVTEIEETGITFIENALLKARHAAKVTGLPAISDDSGLAVSALAGAPGIYSARYAGKTANPADNIDKLLKELENVEDADRHACFHCVLVYLEAESDPTPIVCDGKWHGVIIREKKGLHGFGYDPVFYLPELGKTAAELDATIKNTLSHRALAFKALLAALQGAE